MWMLLIIVSVWWWKVSQKCCLVSSRHSYGPWPFLSLPRALVENKLSIPMPCGRACDYWQDLHHISTTGYSETLWKRTSLNIAFHKGLIIKVLQDAVYWNNNHCLISSESYHFNNTHSIINLPHLSTTTTMTIMYNIIVLLVIVTGYVIYDYWKFGLFHESLLSTF